MVYTTDHVIILEAVKTYFTRNHDSCYIKNLRLAVLPAIFKCLRLAGQVFANL